MDQLRVNTAQGWVEGVRARGALCYLGIPYAQPPVGDLRFLPPVPHEGWEGVRSAKAFGASPMQFPSTQGSEVYEMRPCSEMAEDCLTLNVFTPEGAQEKALPVMVWLYGGAYCTGSSSIPMYRGEALASKQNVVVVTFNYRLGIFGFMAHPSLRERAAHHTNAGLADMLLALRWVQRNIGAFGGDATSVTIFGESAGSAAVNTLLVCPAAKGLFHRAISQSFSPFNHDEWDRDEQGAAQRCERYLASVGIGEDELFSAPAMQFLADPRGYYGAQFSPYVDGDLLPMRLEEAFLRGAVHDVPVLLGCTADEATALIGDPTKVTREQFDKTLAQKYPQHWQPLEQHYGPLVDEHPATGLARFRSDNTLANMRYYASCLQAHNRAPIYFYLFARIVPGLNSQFYRAYHAGEIPYHFQTLDLMHKPFTPDDYALSDIMAAYWANFARTGDPNGTDLPPWPPFAPDDGAAMRLDVTTEFAPVGEGAPLALLTALLDARTRANNPAVFGEEQQERR